MDIQAVVAGNKLSVASVIPEQDSLKKLWEDIKDLCFDQPTRHATEVRFGVMLPWETSTATVKSDCDLQAAFIKLRDKKYPWAMFIIKTELDDLSRDTSNLALPGDTSDIDESPAEQFVVPVEPADEMDWFDLADENEFALPDLNDEVHIEQMSAPNEFELWESMFLLMRFNIWVVSVWQWWNLNGFTGSFECLLDHL